MTDRCRIPNAIEKIFAASHCGVAYIGGSLTVGVGASDTSRTSWRALFTQYLYREYHPRYHCQVGEIMGAIGACESYVGVFTLGRNVLPANPDLAIVEFCVNDNGAPDEELVLKGLDGIVRQLLCAKSRCEVMLLGTGNRDGTIDHSRHRRVAEHYGLPFVDAQSYVLESLKSRGASWDEVAIDFEEGDAYHLNDRGNRLVFDALCECFEREVALFSSGSRRERTAAIPEPLVSDELQFVKLIDPSKPGKSVTLEGDWTEKHAGEVPWYYDHLLAGRPGSSITLAFEGTAVAVFGLMYHNGLKLEAELDGGEIPGTYLRHFIEFGKGHVLAHGLPPGRHVLKLTVAAASKRHNKHPDPSAQVAYLGVAAK